MLTYFKSLKYEIDRIIIGALKKILLFSVIFALSFTVIMGAQVSAQEPVPQEEKISI